MQKLDPQILEMVCSEILEGSAGSSVAWEDIAGQAQAKRLVQELVVWPMLNPHLFKVGQSALVPAQKTLCFTNAACNAGACSLVLGDATINDLRADTTADVLRSWSFLHLSAMTMLRRAPGRRPRGCCYSALRALARR